MSMTAQQVDALMQCDCYDGVSLIGWTVGGGRIEIVVRCNGCGRIVSASGALETIGDVTFAVTPRAIE